MSYGRSPVSTGSGCMIFAMHGHLPARERRRTSDVMEILGHSTIRLAMDLYEHVLPDRLRAAASAMDRVMETR